MQSPSPVIAGPPSDCCFTTVQHVGTPVGQTITIAGVPTYVSTPKADLKKVILFFPDVFGPFYINNQLLQDSFAANGYLVLGGFDRSAWFAKARVNAADVLPGWIDGVRQKYGVHGISYSAVGKSIDTTEADKFQSTWHYLGYCFGAPYVFELLGGDMLSAGAVAHPTLINEDHLYKIQKPLLLSCAEIDFTFPLDKRRRAEDILIEHKANYHFQIFSGVAHGFAIRGDPSVENTRWAKEQSAKSIVEWFDRFSKMASSARSLL
ncbi:alpha/beta-hydrolase [Pleurotus eryngii]|uniref:Alpha/beta-hydrolase n=1 Tax=Pleurotus eryngii TaxID=5323 RepID=A0A9P6A158_PLEER|nr:alpha/beta-hydrolase [Pleurotus eryngii]